MRHWQGALIAVLAPFVCVAQTPDRTWIEQSNQHTGVLLEVIATYNPEQASAIGVEGHDDEVVDLKPGYIERQEAALLEAARQLEPAREATADPRVKQDIEILIDAAQDQATTLALNRRLMLPYLDLPQLLFNSFQNLLDERVAKERQAAAVTRLRRYVGSERGDEPITELYQARFEEAAKDTTLTGPWIVQVEQHLDNLPRYVEGVRQLLADSGLKGWQKDFKTFSRQLDEYAEWVRTTVVPRARQTNQLPPEIYADNLKNFGVEMDPQQLMDRALFSYQQTREELQALARLIAEKRGWKSSDYRDVIRQLKQEKISNDEILDLYRSRLRQVEAIVREQDIVTLPTRDAVIRLATEAESAAQPAPHVDLPRLIGNTGEPAEFVLPLRNPNAKPGVEMDDFTFDAITWTLTAHEARPGHELQFAAMLEQGVSIARVVFAFNSANAEGWALYAESILKPYLPLEGQIGTLQMRLLRAARAYLDPMLNLGLIEPEAAQRLLMEEVMLSEPMAKQEVDRYTFDAPGQATSYFYGYGKLEALRAKAELALADQFDARAFHDFIVNEGLLPLDLLDKTVMAEFVPAQLKGS